MRRSVYNHYAFTQYVKTAPASEKDVWLNITSDDWRDESHNRSTRPIQSRRVQKEGVASLYALLFRKMLTSALELESMDCLVLERPNPTGSEFSQRRIPTKLDDFSCGAKRCRERLHLRIKSKAAIIVSDADALARAEQELQLEHDAVFMALKSREIILEQCKGTDLDPLQILEVEQHRPSNALSRLLDVEVPTSSGDNQWKNTSVKWSCASQGGKYNALQLYREVDVLSWFKNHEEHDHPAIARIYLAKPLSTAVQERFFSLRGYVVNELRTRLDDDRAEMMCLMKANWQEYKHTKGNLTCCWKVLVKWPMIRTPVHHTGINIRPATASSRLVCGGMAPVRHSDRHNDNHVYNKCITTGMMTLKLSNQVE
ncbi:Ribonuclease H-like domain [Phytophthora cactorum]|nr:Ribonuclease H-like domain [Phytophthora cactorum]